MIRIVIAFGAGLGAKKVYDLSEQYLRETRDYNGHAFQNLMKELKFSQPKVVELLHKSDQFHFLHNFIIQNERSALNFIKVYCPEDIESSFYNQDIKSLTDEEKKEKIKVNVIFNSSDEVQGHSGVVHGGLQATLLDNAFGYVSVISANLQPSATAFLNINYKKPVKTNQDYMISCTIEKIDGRKIYLKGVITDVEGKIYTEATALFVRVNWGTSIWRPILENNPVLQDKSVNQGNSVLQDKPK